MRSKPTPCQRFLLAYCLTLGFWVLGAASQVETVTPQELAPGARGYGLSVFVGTEPERFEVEVLGLMRNLDPGTDFILARLTGHGLEKSGVVAGMSGSPVFIDGRLAGAVSFGWSFSNEAIAGITPITEMRATLDLPGGIASAPGSGEPLGSGEPQGSGEPIGSRVPLARIIDRDLPIDLLDRGLRGFLQDLPEGASPLSWSTVGFGESTRRTLSTSLGNVTPAGSDDTISTELEAGSAVAGVLLDGDLRMAFTGTVTERIDDGVIAFGHSFQGFGPVRMPMATAEIVTIISSQTNSFKIANIGPVVGAFDQDRSVGMAGRIGAVAPTIPLRIRIPGDPQRDYSMRMADLPQLVPTLLATTVIQALDTGRHNQGNQGLTLRASIDIENHQTLKVDQVFDGNNASFGSAIYLLSLLSFLTQDTGERVTINAIDIEIDHTSQPLTGTLVGAHAGTRRVFPGDRIELFFDVRAYRGDVVRSVVEVEIPDDARPGPYYLFVGDGTSVDALRFQIAPQEPRDLAGGIALLNSLHSPSDLVILGATPAQGLVVEGRTLPDLPSSMRSVWNAAGPLAARGVNLAIQSTQTERLAEPMTGATRIDLRVEARLD